jgi:hypothetical protein
LFQQPEVAGIAGNFAVPLANHKAPPVAQFAMVLWQPNRFQPSGQLVATGWDAGSQTGFTPTTSVTAAQLGFQNKPGTSTAQMEGATVGAYINSSDLPPAAGDQKMMIAPEFTFANGNEPVPFAGNGTSLNGSVDLQVPTAQGSEAYVIEYLVFTNPGGVKISFGISMFHDDAPHLTLGSGYDSPSESFILTSPIGLDQRFVAQSSGSAAATGIPWSGWRHFAWSVSETQFADALGYLASIYPGKGVSTDPSQYVLTQLHLNAEFHTEGQPAELGWSMQNLMLWTSP